MQFLCNSSILFLFVLGQVYSVRCQWEKYFYPNEENCGVTEEIDGDIRTSSPWTVAIYTRRNILSPFQYFVTGTLISPTAVLTAFGGGYGQPPYLNRKKEYYIPPPSHYLIAAGLRSTDLNDTDGFTQFANVTYISPFKANSSGNEEYHMVIFRLASPVDLTSPYVRALCQPFHVLPYFRSIGLEGRFSDLFIFSSDVEESFTSGFNAPIGASEPFKRTFVKVTSRNDAECLHAYEYYYKTHPDEIFCLKVLPGEGVSNSTCLTHGSPKFFQPNLKRIGNSSFTRPDTRYYGSGLVALVPRKERGQCGLNTTYLVLNIWSGIEWIKKNMMCDASTYPCTDEDKCIPMDQVCDGKPDCSGGNDEDPIYCTATKRCKSSDSYQCGYEGKCISIDRLWNGIKDCPSGSDEDGGHFAIKHLARAVNVSEENKDFCPPLLPTSGLMTKCVHPQFGEVDCSKASPETTATLHCGRSYRPLARTNLTKMKCYDDKTWKPTRNFSCRPDCGLLDDEIQPYIVQGEEVNSKKLFPWHAAVLRVSGNESCEHVCGATLIERNILITAAHCTTDEQGLPFNTTDLQIVLNSALSSTNLSTYSKENPEDVFEVEQIWRPWSFNVKTLQSDIAIIKLTSPVTYSETVKPICYLLNKFTRVPPADATGTVPGFGITETGVISSTLKFVHMQVLPEKDCGTIADDSFCAKSSQPGASLCHGDSGGGFVLPFDSKDDVTKYLLKGVASGHNGPKGHSCDLNSNSISSFTHVDYHSEWLLTILQGIYSDVEY